MTYNLFSINLFYAVIWLCLLHVITFVSLMHVGRSENHTQDNR